VEAASEDPQIILIIEEICCGNADAQTFLWAFLRWVHWLDGVVDGDKDGDREPQIVALINTDLFLVAASNPFFQAHRDGLLALVIQAMAAWVDSNEWARREPQEHRIAADVLKGMYHEIFWHTAALCGGLAHMLAMTAKHREFDFESCIIQHEEPVAAATAEV